MQLCVSIQLTGGQLYVALRALLPPVYPGFNGWRCDVNALPPPPPPPTHTHKRLCAWMCLSIYTQLTNVWNKCMIKDGEISSCEGNNRGKWNSRRTAVKSKVWDAYLIINITYNISLLSFKTDFQCDFWPDSLVASGGNRTDPETIAADREPAAALPGASLLVWTEPID